MNSQKKALTYALSAIAALALAMVAFYYVQSRMAASNGTEEVVGEEIVKGEKSEFVGTYSPDGPLEAAGKRISFFTVNAKEEGGYLGSVKLDTIGTDEVNYLECVDVKIEEGTFFLSCQNPAHGNISYNGSWQKNGGTIQVDGKVLWTLEGNAILEQERRLQLIP